MLQCSCRQSLGAARCPHQHRHGKLLHFARVAVDTLHRLLVGLVNLGREFCEGIFELSQVELFCQHIHV
jgi:hypothetical protein